MTRPYSPDPDRRPLWRAVQRGAVALPLALLGAGLIVAVTLPLVALAALLIGA